MAYIRYEAHTQYQTEAEANACKAFVDGWVTDNDSLIDSGPMTSGHSLQVLDPPHQETGDPEICGHQLDVVYYLRGPSNDVDNATNAITQAITMDLGTATCASSTGISNEE